MGHGKNRLTSIQVKNAGDGTLRDGGGLTLIRKNGKGRWIWRYQFMGRRRDMGLGSQETVSLADARTERDKWAAVAASGRDPIQAREQERLEAATAANDPTFKDMTSITFEAIRESLKGDGTAGRWRSPIDLYMIPAIGHRQMSAITPIEIRDALAPIWRKKHPTAEKAIQRTGMIFEHAQLSGVDCDPVAVKRAKHMLGAVDHKPQPIEATPWQEIPDLFQKLNSGGSVDECLKWCILNLTRSDACRGARFDEIEGDVWTVPPERVKGRRGRTEPFRVPLSPPALEIVASAAEWGGELLFPSPRAKTLSDQGLTKRLNAIGETGRVHGFRTSFRTWVQDTDACSFEVAETILGHTIGGRVERTYARSDLLERRRHAMNAWADYVTGSASGVVQLRR